MIFVHLCILKELLHKVLRIAIADGTNFGAQK